jgi:hypothetical protein
LVLVLAEDMVGFGSLERTAKHIGWRMSKRMDQSRQV